jgi:hypothetical protein
MKYDPQGSGAAPGDLLVRRGIMWESAARLERLAAMAEQAGIATNGVPFGHGVSLTSPEANQQLARDPNDAATTTRQELEMAGFEVRYTPTRKDADHHTVILTTPVTDEVAVRFNTLLRRSP